MRKDKIIYIIVFLVCVVGCSKNSHKNTELKSEQIMETVDNQQNEIFKSKNKLEEVQNHIVSEESNVSNNINDDILKRYDRDLWNSDIDDELTEIDFDGSLSLFDLTIRDSEDEAYNKLIKHYETIKKDYSFEGINWYTNRGINNGITINDVELAYYKGSLLSFFKDNLSQNQLQNICNMLNVECDISKLNDSEFYKVKSGKWRFYFSHHYGDKYEYYLKDSSIDF
ncbi:MAG: hypothetical protein IK002_08635 [Treponema sp.]|uniref:hypothetical protein n=1 Tax=Treponema sp. TaxID=166 RepID=UPI00298D956F|nr:hypothetical protein [Treponema sp.]MBR5934035.1 hypothetical protein [Treponema sp.]